MNSPHRALLALVLFGLAGSSAMAQTNDVAVSEVVGGGSQGQVQIFSLDPTTGLPTAVVATVSGHGLSNPFGLSYDSSSQNLYIASLGSNQVFAYNVPGGTLAPVITLPTGYFNPNGVLVTGGNLYVSAFNGGTAGSPGAVLEYNLSNLGNGPAMFAGNGLIGPTGLAVDNSGNVYANSSENGRVYELTSPTPTQLALTTNGVDPSVLSAPAGLAFGTGTNGTAGLLFESNFFNQFGTSTNAPSVSAYDASGTLTSNVTGGYSNVNPPFGGPSGIALGVNAGQVLVTDYGDSSVYLYTSTAGGVLSGPSPFLTLGPNATPAYLTVFDPPAPTPEPSSLALLALGGMAGLIARRRLRRVASAG